MNPLVWPVSAAWSSASWIVREAVARGLLKPVKLEAARVISIGNIQAGGAGKTPLVIEIAREAGARGLSVCILSRGYGGEWKKCGGVIAPGAGVVDPALSGDEPALLQLKCPRAWVAVGADRVTGYARAREKFGRNFDLVLLDDGFQHWKIRRDLEIIAVTSARPSERVFRDWPRELERADLLVWTKGERQPSAAKRWVKVEYSIPRHELPGKPVWLVCGVADPAAVSASFRKAGWNVQREIFRKDHVTYSAGEIAGWLREADRQGCRVAVTGKDWVKWRALGVQEADVVVVEPELVFESGRDLWESCLWG